MKKKFLIFSFLFGIFPFVSGAQNHKNLQKFNSNFFRGVNNYIIHNYSKSIKNLTDALIYNDSVAAVYYYLALNYHEKNMPEQKYTHIKKAIALQPGEPVFRQILEKWEKEEKNLQNNTPLNPSEQNTHSETEKSLVYSLIQQQKFDEAYQSGKKLLEKYPYDVSLIYYTALAAYQLKKWDEARSLLENGMDFALTDKEMYGKFRELLRKIKAASK